MRQVAPVDPTGDDRLTIVVPAFNEAESLPALHRELIGVAREIKAEYRLSIDVIYVDDGSRDGTLDAARALASEDIGLQIVSFSRNFGKEAALLAGLDFARPGAVLFMDADGQHAPDLVKQLVSGWRRDRFDVVYTYKAHREGEPALRRAFTALFYRLLNYDARQPIPEDAGDFRLLSPRAADALRQMPERNRFFKGLSSWIGFRQRGIAYEPRERIAGATKWNFFQLLGLSIEGLTAFSIAPLRVASLLGVLLAATALAFGGFILLESLLKGVSVPGYPSVIVGLMVIGGVQLIMIGVMGEYIAKALSELKGRPAYFVAEHIVRGEGEAAAEPPAQEPRTKEQRAAE